MSVSNRKSKMRLAIALCALAAPALAFAGPYDGVFKQVANADCSLVGVDGGAVEIKDGIFYGVEVECRMTRPVSVVNMDATLFTMNCSGGDQVWSERAMLMRNKETNGLIMVWNGYAFAYDSCEAPKPDSD
jgi:hypothetical protein